MPDAGALLSADAATPKVKHHKTLDLAFHEAQMEFRPIARDGLNPEKGYTFSKLPTVLEALVPILNKHGLFLMQPTEVNGNRLDVRTQIVHAKTSAAKESLYPVCDARELAQTKGATLTYARRNAALSIMGVAPEAADNDAADANERARDVNDDRADIPSTFEVEPQVSQSTPFLKGAAAKSRVNDLLRRMSEARDLDELESIWREASRLNVSANRTSAMEEHYERCGFAFGAGDPLPAPPLFDEEPKAETDAQIYTRLLMALNKAKDKDALTTWAEELTDDVLAALNDEQRASLRSEYDRRVNPA